MSLEDSPGRSADYPALEDATPIVEPAPVVQSADR